MELHAITPRAFQQLVDVLERESCLLEELLRRATESGLLARAGHDRYLVRSAEDYEAAADELVIVELARTAIVEGIAGRGRGTLREVSSLGTQEQRATLGWYGARLERAQRELQAASSTGVDAALDMLSR